MAVKRFNILSRIPLYPAIILLSAALALSAVPVHAQEIPVQLEQAMTSGNAKNFSRMFDERVEIDINGERRDYSQQQAQVVLSDFLSALGKVDFELIHEETARNQSTYYIGKMTADGVVYRVYVTVHTLRGTKYIQSIKFEKQ